jgi:hypothetical protein
MDNGMFYKFSFEVLGLRSHLKEIEEIEFRLNTPKDAVVYLNKKNPDGQQPLETSSAICVGIATREIADDEIASEFNVALSTSLDGLWANFAGVSPDRMPLILKVIDDVYHTLGSAMQAIVTVLRWRGGLIDGSTNPFRNPRGYCSLNGEAWLQVSMARSAELILVPGPKQITASDKFLKEIVELVETGKQEPLGHQLLREAWSQREANPRSALAIGVAAAEVGLKQLIGSLIPEAQWLVDEIQTPPVSKMLRKFLPTLPVKAKLQGKSLRPPNELIKKLDEAFEQRNKLVHVGKAPPHSKNLEEMLRAVNDFLYICDVYVGHVWAADYISIETRGAWEDEKS